MMKIINKILFLVVCSLCLANPVKAEYHEQNCPSDGGECPTGWTKMEGEDRGFWNKITNEWIKTENHYCVCYKCDEGEECVMAHGIMKGCASLPSKLSEARKCLFCPLFEALYMAVQTMATKAFEATKDPIRNVILYGFAIYIAFGVLKLVSTITKQDAPKYISGLLIDTCKFLVAFLLLHNATYIYYYLINPLLSTALDFGGAMLFTAGDTISQCKTDSTGLEGSSSVILPNELYVSLDCFIRGVQSEIAFVQAAGSSIMCIGMHEAVGAGGIWDFSMVFSGLAVYLCALLLSIAFGFYLIDSVVMLGILGALMTFFIACWPFKLTGGYTGKGFNMFMNIFFTFIFMGIVVSINTQLIKASLAAGGLENLEATLSGNNIRDVKEVLDITGAGFLVILCCCFFGFKFTAKSSSLASSMAGGGGIDIGAKLGTLLASGAVNSATRVGKSAIKPTMKKMEKGIGNAVNKSLEVTGDAIFHPMKSARKFGGVMTKRFGQAQKAVGATQGMMGNLKGDADMIKKGEELYKKGKAHQAQGQARIDAENAALHPENQKDTNYENFNGNNNDSEGNNNGNNSNNQNNNQQTDTNNTADNNNTNQNSNNNQQQTNNVRESANNKYNEDYENKQPDSLEECKKLCEQAESAYQYHIEEFTKYMNDIVNMTKERFNAQSEMIVAQNKMNTATNPTEYNNAQMQYEQANQKYTAIQESISNSLNNGNEHQVVANASAMAFEKYKYAGEQMKQGNSVDWNLAHKIGQEGLFDGIKNIKNAGPRNG